MKALSISGGGSRGSFAIGALEVLMEEKGYTWDLISGTSTGALIAPLIAIGDLEEAKRIYTSVRTKNILRLNWRRLFRDALFDTKPLEKLIRTNMADRFDRLQSASTPRILLCSVGCRTGLVKYGTQWPMFELPSAVFWANFNEFVAAVLASTNQPFFMPPSVFGGEPCFDGGVREVAPVGSVVKAGATELVVIANSPERPKLVPKNFTSICDTGLRSIDLMTTEILNNDISLHKDSLDITVIRPKEELPSTGLDFNPEIMKDMMETGRKCAREEVG